MNHGFASSILGVAIAWTLLAAPASSQACTPSWQPTFGGQELSGPVEDLAVFDDGLGGGPALYATGSFVQAGGVGVNSVASWDGERWSALGDGLNGAAFALAVFDDGSGDGPALYVGGGFTIAGGVVAHRIAKWDGTSWSNVGSGMNNTIRVLTVFDDGDGPQLYAGGEFTIAGGLTVNHVARWNGSSWRSLGTGIDGINVLALESFDDGLGGGPALCVGGAFTEAGGIVANHLARWDGSSWSSLGGPHALDGAVFALADLGSLDGGAGRLAVGGSFLNAGAVPAQKIAIWDGSGWSALGSGMSSAVHELIVHDDGSGGGPALIAGGSFNGAGGVLAKKIAKWDGASWSGLGGGMDGSGDDVNALAVLDDGSGGGPALFAGGSFDQAADSGDPFLAKWGCAAPDPVWTDLGSGLAGTAGVPSLAGAGTLVAGSPGSLTLTSANPSSLTNLFVSFASTPAPFKGGTLVPVPPALTLALFTSGAGSIPLAWPAWPAGVPSGASLFFQHAIADPAAPAGVALSNALQATTP